MNRIDKNNYEAFFLDYHEGRLNAVEEQKVMAFLKEHPEFYDEFEDYGEVILPVPEFQYPHKSDLYKTDISLPDSDEWEYKCIAFMEGDLTEEELSDFEAQRLSDPEKAKVLELYLSTRSVPEEDILFHDKSVLKKKVLIIPRWIYGAVSAAAILVLSWIIFAPQAENFDDQLVAKDSSRQVIYMDKISHPGKYEKVASVEQRKTPLNSTLMAKLDNQDDFQELVISEDDWAVRDNYSVSSLPPLNPEKVESVFETTISNSMAYRYIPSAEDEQYSTLLAFSGEFARKKILGQDPELVNKSKFSLWELADVGLEKITDFFGLGANIEREYNKNGDLVAVTFESPLVGINAPLKRRAAVQND